MSIETKTVEVDANDHRTLLDMNPVEQNRWVRENIDSDAIAVASISTTFEVDEPSEHRVEYWINNSVVL